MRALRALPRQPAVSRYAASDSRTASGYTASGTTSSFMSPTRGSQSQGQSQSQSQGQPARRPVKESPVPLPNIGQHLGGRTQPRPSTQPGVAAITRNLSHVSVGNEDDEQPAVRVTRSGNRGGSRGSRGGGRGSGGRMMTFDGAFDDDVFMMDNYIPGQQGEDSFSSSITYDVDMDGDTPPSPTPGSHRRQ